VSSSKEILKLVNGEDVVAIDEVQFFDIGIVDVCVTLADKGIRIIAAGLDKDYLGKPFGPMPALMASAEYVTKVHAICVRCGALANFSHRISESDSLIMLGEKNNYEPLCRECFNSASKQEK
jgi:thymidine kinase